MKKCILLLTSLFLIQCAPSKISELYQTYDKEDYLYWSADRNLTWNDFQGEPLSSSNAYVSEIHVYNPSSIEKSNMFSSTKLTTICVFDKKHSWVNKQLATNDLLLYNQIIFNLYELYTRKLRKTFDSTDFGFNDYSEKFHKMTEDLNAKLSERVTNFRKESNLGKNKEALVKWADEISKELEALKQYGMEY